MEKRMPQMRRRAGHPPVSVRACRGGLKRPREAFRDEGRPSRMRLECALKETRGRRRRHAKRVQTSEKLLSVKRRSALGAEKGRHATKLFREDLIGGFSLIERQSRGIDAEIGPANPGDSRGARVAGMQFCCVKR